MTNLDQNKLPEETKGFFDSITGGLKDLMTQITGGINSLLISLGLKKKEEIKGITEKTKNELSVLQELIEINSSISEDEQKIIDKTIKDQEDIKKYFEWIGKTFTGKDKIITKEKENLLVEIKNHKGETITKDDLSEFIKKEKEAMGKITSDTNLKSMIEQIDGQYSIEEIIKAYEEIKGDDDDKKPTKDEVLDKLSE